MDAQNVGMKSIVATNSYDPIYNPVASPAFGTSRDFLPVSPTAGSLGVYGQIPVGNYTGTAEINIPLYEVKYKELSVPIGISYHASGVKPELFPGPVGLGWALMAGGAISRVIKGYPDMGDYPSDGEPSLVIAQRATLAWDNVERLKQFLSRTTLAFANNNEPDEYYFNFNGQSGKFYADHTDTFRIQSMQGHSYRIAMKYEERKSVRFVELGQIPDLFYNISPHLYPYSNVIELKKVITGFTMIDERGIVYNFGGSEKSIEFSRLGFCEYPTFPECYITPTTWFLTSIESPKGYRIELNYQQQTTITRSYFSDVILYQVNNNNMKGHYYAMSPTYNKSTLINGCYLSQITFPNGKVKFDNSLAKDQMDFSFYSSYRNIPPSDFVDFKYYPDVALANTEKLYGIETDSLTPHKLDMIHVYDKSNAEIKKISFVYNYDVERRYRQKLYELRIQGNSEDVQQYTFRYNYLTLPYYMSRATDIYGYWNGKGQFSEVSADDFTEYMRSHPNYLTELKRPDPVYAQAEILTHIFYPTKGYTVFEYEPHEYGRSYHGPSLGVKQNENGNLIAGGVRIKTMRNYDKDNSLLSEKRYHYVKNFIIGGNISSGVLAYTPIFSELYENKKLDCGDNLKYFFRYTTNPIYPLCETRGNFVTYSEVTVEDVGNGYSVFKFKNYDNGYSDHPLRGFVANILESISGGETVDFQQNTEGISMSLERGQLLSQRAYDNNKTLKKEIVNTYNDDPKRFDEHVRFLSYTPLSLNSIGYRYHSISAGVYYTYYPYLKEKRETDYLEDGAVTKTISYEYDSKYRLLKSIQTINSNQKINKRSIYYPHENMNLPICNQMVQNHLLNYPIKEIVQAGGKSTAAYYQYATGLSDENPNLILKESDSSQVDDGPVFVEASYMGYDAIGNPTEINYRTEGENCYLWSYDRMYPVAHIVGVGYNRVKEILGDSFIDNLATESFPSENDIQDIRTKLLILGAKVTTYTYCPLVGVTSITAPNGLKLIYDYDALGRLLTIKDTDGKVVECYNYHYGY